MLAIQGLNSYYGASQVVYDASMSVRRGEVCALLGPQRRRQDDDDGQPDGLRPRPLAVDRARGPAHRRPARAPARARRARLRPAGRARVPRSQRAREPGDRARPQRGRRRRLHPERAFEAFGRLRELSGRDAGLLSGGERQMLAVARALMANPLVVVLDEPSEGLSPVAVELLGDVVERLREAGVGILLAEQNYRFALRLADRGYFIEKGRIHHEGGAEEIARPEVLERYLGV